MTRHPKRTHSDTLANVTIILIICLAHLPVLPCIVIDWVIRKPLGWFYGLYQRSKLRIGQIVWLESSRQEQERMGCPAQGLVVDLSRIGGQLVGVRKRGVTSHGNIYH